MPVKQGAGIACGAGGQNASDVDEVIPGIDGLIDATIEPSEDIGQDRRACFGNFAQLRELFRTFFVGAFARKKVRKIALVFRKNVHGKNARGTNHGSRTRTFVRAEQDQRRVERDRGKRAGGHSKWSAFVGRRDDCNARSELSESFAKRTRVYGHGGTVGLVEGLGEMIGFTKSSQSSLLTREAKCAANHADCGARHQEHVQGAGGIHHEARDGHEGHAEEHQKNCEEDPIGLAENHCCFGRPRCVSKPTMIRKPWFVKESLRQTYSLLTRPFFFVLM